jgi:hypothetical protein
MILRARKHLPDSLIATLSLPGLPDPRSFYIRFAKITLPETPQAILMVLAQVQCL